MILKNTDFEMHGFQKARISKCIDFKKYKFQNV